MRMPALAGGANAVAMTASTTVAPDTKSRANRLIYHSHRCSGRGAAVSELSPDRLGLQVGLDAFLPVLVAPAGLLVAAEGHGVVEHQLAVDRDGARLESLPEPMCTAEVVGP